MCPPGEPRGWTRRWRCGSSRRALPCARGHMALPCCGRDVTSGGIHLDRDEYQRLRRQLDEELRAGIEMLQAGHRAKVEALDARWQEPAGQVVPAGGAAPEPAVQAAPVP